MSIGTVERETSASTSVSSPNEGNKGSAPCSTSSNAKVEGNGVDDVRLLSYRPLISPLLLRLEFPLSAKGLETVSQARLDASRIISQMDDRLLVVVGPCSLHNVDSALEYGRLLQQLSVELKEDLLIIMRTYFEKPRTTVGWKGLINDPDIDGR